MHDSRTFARTWARVALIGAGILASSAAIAFPWDIDMADSAHVKAYEQPMRGIPEGVVSQEHLLTPQAFSPNYDRMTPEGQALRSPLTDNGAAVELGAEMYGIYCTPCHGDGVTNGPVGDPTAKRFPAVLALGGPAGILPARTDGYVYLTIRNGGAIMPYYGWAMTDEEMWSIVHYAREKIPNGKYKPPPPPAPPEDDDAAEGIE